MLFCIIKLCDNLEECSETAQLAFNLKMKNLGLINKAITIVLFLTFVIQANSQATLPLTRTTWDAGAPLGWTDFGTGDYNTTFACSGSNMGSLNDDGDYYQVFFNSTPNQLSFALKSASMSGESSCLVQESPDGAAWSTLGVYGTAGGATTITNCAIITHTLNATTRYVRWIYTKETGNCGLDDVEITEGVACSDPTVPASTITFPSTDATTMQINWTNGNGTNRLVVIGTSPISATPVDATPYTANTTFGAGDEIAPDEFVVFNGTGNTVTVTGLSANTTYYVTIFEFNNPGACYLTSSSASSSETTLSVVPTQLTFTSVPIVCTEINGAFSVTVCATDAGGNIDNTYTGTITLSMTSEPGGATLGGTLTSSATSGCVTFSGLTLDVAGNYTLGATDGVLSGSSNTITISSTCELSSTWQGLIINEASNGESGNKEYYEFVVAGECGTIVDIRNWILDDNNGTFSAVWPPTGTGIAQGHFRLTNHVQWSAIPVGSLILIYNDDDKNDNIPDEDPFDANDDFLYVIPHNNADLFESCDGTVSIPVSAGDDSDSTYSPCVYKAPTIWTPLSIANAGDAIQVRGIDGSYWHGISYGSDDALTGGPDNLKVSLTGGTGYMLYFNDGDYKDVANWSSGAAGVNETPGVANNALNQAWLDTIRNPSASTCPVYNPLSFLQFYFGAKINENGVVQLTWNIFGEEDEGVFVIKRSDDGKKFKEIGSLFSDEIKESYEFLDKDILPSKTYYYKVTFISTTNKQVSSRTRIVKTFKKDYFEVYPNPSNGNFNILINVFNNKKVVIEITDIVGKISYQNSFLVEKGINTIPINNVSLAKGTYLLSIIDNYQKNNKRIIIE